MPDILSENGKLLFCRLIAFGKEREQLCLVQTAADAVPEQTAAFVQTKDETALCRGLTVGKQIRGTTDFSLVVVSYMVFFHGRSSFALEINS